MTFFTFLLFLSQLFISLSQPENMIDLDDNTFDTCLQQNDIVTVTFYAPWCTYSKDFLIEFEKAANIQKKSNSSFVFARIDVTISKKVSEQFQIQKYPVIILFTDFGKIKFVYEGERDANSLLSFIERKIRPKYIKLESIDEVLIQLDKAKILVVYGGEVMEPDFEIFLQAASFFDNSVFVNIPYPIFLNVTEKSLNDSNMTNDSYSENIRIYNPKLAKIAILKTFDELVSIYPDEIQYDNLIKFIKINSRPNILNFNQLTSHYIFKENQTAIILFRSSNNNSIYDVDFSVLAKKFKGKILFIIADNKNEYELKLIDYFGIKVESFPRLEIIEGGSSNNSRFLYEDPIIDKDLLNKFLENYFAHRLQRYYKSQPIPKPNNKRIKEIVSKNWDVEVINNTNNIIVFFYTKWSKSCLEFEIIYEKLAKKIKKSSDLVLAKIDIEENEVKGINIQSYPTLWFYKNGEKETPIEFAGNKTEEDIISFLIEKNITININIQNTDL